MYGENMGDMPTTIEQGFRDSVYDGLRRQQKSLPCRWLYDTRGSELFEQITALPEYYPTRTEISILETHSNAIAEAIGIQANIVEFGAGAGTKTRLLLNALQQPHSYTAIDISADFLDQTMQTLAADYPAIRVTPVVADFMSASTFARMELPPGHRTGFFPGSTIGNLSDPEIRSFLCAARKALGNDAGFLIGIDLVKGTEILIPAYDDAAGITAAFNLNLLTRINRELDGNFNLDSFAHEARWNTGRSQIEMHLVSQKKQMVTVGRQTFSFAAGETIHTENSRKFDLRGFTNLAAHSGWQLQQTWMDDNQYFCVALLS